ncbi:DUF4003 family protein [Sporosarcina sp. G11-34]|uniref:DUF4003 family protein n=1 Tax=Sporosarcina sp. G11-34 TaxID=2849605 RepID=UPI0022A8E829|nr:DUF4003 family protein [Sporosarcina sp. G11-34]MCZ2259085.1 DUF4003 domain-containing protein [Sporosarcina sp. G11-34]
MDTNAIVREVEETYEKVKSLAGWTVDKNVVLTITSYYVTSEREFDAENLNRAMDALKSKSGWLSPLRGNLLPMVGAFLDKPRVNIETETDRLFEKQRVLRGVGFRNTIHSYLAALLMTDNEELYDHEAQRAKKLYNEMKKQHFFLTSDDDYAYAVLLGKRNENPVAHAKLMRTYYDTLRVEGFRSGNELQWMSQVMTYLNSVFDSQLVSQATEVLDYFKRETKVRPVHYPMIGFLAVFGVGDDGLMKIVELTRALEDSKPFKWKREMALSIAIGYVMQELTDMMEETGVSLVASVEMILQAQQAVMAATIAAMAASSATNSSSD